VIALIIAGCSGTAPEPTPPPAAPVRLARPEPDWIMERAAAAEARLQESDAGLVVLQGMSAAGGLRNWYALSPLSFRFDYRPTSGKKPRDSTQVVDLWRSRAVHTWTADPQVTFGWDGEQAWTRAPEGVELPFNARFWSLTPYYFVGMPFVLADEGVQLTLEGPGTFEDEPCTLVRVGFADGTGDAPDDAYVVYLSDDDRRVVALRYIVTYPGFFDEGESSPWKIMAYDGSQRIGGVALPQTFRTFTWDDGPGELVTEITLSDVAPKPELPLDALAMPDGAEVQAAL